MRKQRSLLVAAFLAFLAPAEALAAKPEVALTFDDLPALTILHDQRYIDLLNKALLRKLRHHHLPAIGFVNEGKLDDLKRDHQIANLRRWVDAGMELGNHTYSHSSLNAVGAKPYIADIDRGELITKALLLSHGERLRFFRAPYLETGKTREIKGEVATWLTEHRYRMAPVTIDADDWEFAEPYDDAIARRDRRAQRDIKAEYLVYTARRVAWAQASAKILFGRKIAQIMLLHCTRLNADTLDYLAKLLRHAHLVPVTLDKAMQDPVYQEPDAFVEADGADWLTRWAAARHVNLPDAGNQDPPEDISAAYDRVDNDRQ